MSHRIHSTPVLQTFSQKQDGRGTFRLRYQLAEDGCIESQVALAKSLLSENTDSCEDRFSNANLAIFFLLQAAEKGNKEAFDLLTQCNVAGTGITLQNRFSVEKCLQLSEQEKIATRVGHSVFRAVMSDTDEPVSEETFQERVELILNREKVESETNISDSSDTVLKSPERRSSPDRKPDSTQPEGTKRVTVNDMVTSVQQCLEGNLPLVALKRVVQYEEYNKWFSLKYARLLWNLLCRALERLIEDLSSPILPCAIFFIALLLWMVTYFVIPGNEMYIIVDKYRVFFTSLISLFTMLSCTCYVIFINFGYYNVNQWLNLVKIFEPTVKSNEVKQNYFKKTVFPLFAFFCCSIIYNILDPLNSIKFSSGELCIISFVLLVLVDRTITTERYHVSISLVLNILLCLYKGNYLNSISCKWFDAFNFDIWFNVSTHYEIHINCISCITLPLVLPYLYIKMALGQERKGWQLVLLPHLMCITWMNLTFNHLKVCGQMHLFWSLCFWLIVLFFTYYMGAIPALFLCSLAKVLYLSENWLQYMTLFLVPLFIGSFLISLMLVKKLKTFSKMKTYASVLFVVVIAIVFRNPTSTSTLSNDPADTVLSWDQYQTLCHRHAWYQTNTAEVAIACLPLKGKRISLDGTVTAIDMVEIQNPLQQVASILPSPFSEWFTCAFGKTYNSCHERSMTSIEKERCLLYQTMNLDGCHLHNWDVYRYEILLEVSSRTSPEINVLVDHSCSAFIKILKEGDSLQIIGVLDSKLGSLSPKLLLLEATCNSCYETIDCNMLPVASQTNYDLSMQHIVSFYLSPFIQYVA